MLITLFPNSLSIIVEAPRVHLLTDFITIPLVSTVQYRDAKLPRRRFKF